MICTTSKFWEAFFDPTNPDNKKANKNLISYDQEKIIIPESVLTEVSSWLIRNKKSEINSWFIDYACYTSNVRIFIFTKSEIEEIGKISIQIGVSFSDASVSYLQKKLLCDVAEF